MKESILDVLLYLFENYFYEDPDAVRDRESLQTGLVTAGFSPAEITKAFDWLDELAQGRGRLPDQVGSTAGPVRVYSDREEARLDAECRGFMLFLEQAGVLDAERRELVVDRVLALDHELIDIEDLKWVVLMVLFNQPGQEAAFAWMENHMFDDAGDVLH